MKKSVNDFCLGWHLFVVAFLEVKKNAAFLGKAKFRVSKELAQETASSFEQTNFVLQSLSLA